MKFLAKGGKAVLVAVFAIFAGLIKAFKSLFDGSGSSGRSDTTEQPPFGGVQASGQQEVPRDPQEIFFDKLKKFEDGGRFGDAVAFIKSEKRNQVKTDYKIAGLIYNFSKKAENTKEMLHQAPNYLGLMVKEGVKDQVCSVYRECTALDPQFAPEPSILFQIAQWLNDGKKYPEVINCLIHFTKRYPKNPLVVDAYFLLAKILNEKKDNQAKAIEILQKLKKGCSGHKLIPEIDKDLEKIGFLEL